MASVGAAVAVYVQPPARPWLIWLLLAWLVALLALTRFVVRRATGRGVTGTPMANQRYFAKPERFALGAAYSFAVGAGLATCAVLATLTALAR